MSRNVETTLDLRFSGAGEACAAIATGAAGDVGRQAELLCLARYIARSLNRVTPERQLQLIGFLLELEELPTRPISEIAAVRVVPASSDFPVDASTRVVCRFIDARHEPRMFFKVKANDSRSQPGRADEGAGWISAYVACRGLLTGDADAARAAQLIQTTRAVARICTDGWLTPVDEFAAALAAADLGWRAGTVAEAAGPTLQCPNCGSRGARHRHDTQFELRLWPSAASTIWKCGACGGGIWKNGRRPPRSIPESVWNGLESLRQVAAERYDDGGSGDATRATEGGAGELLAHLKRAFAANGWPFAEVRDRQVLVSDLSGVWGTWKFYAQVVPEHHAILFYSICPFRVPAELRGEAADFLTRANYGLASGNFELDFDDGEIRYKTALDVDGDVDPAAVKRAVRANGVAMETYLPGIGAVVTGSSSQHALDRRVEP